MFRCLDCDFEFDEPKTYMESHGFDYPPYEEFYGCPLCGGGYEEVEDEDEEELEDEYED